jgi:uncharacterized membrane protein
MGTVGAVVDDRTAQIQSRGREWWSRWEDATWVRRRVPQLALVVLLVWYFAVFEHLVWQRQANYGTFDYDLGMYDQAVWLLAHGRHFMTVRGMDVFGQHANFGFILFIPFYWLGAGSQFLDVMNTLGVVACAVPIYFLGKRHLRSDWAGLALAAVYLFHFIPQWMIHETFHPENIAAPALLGAFYFASVQKWKWYWWCVAFALIWKEDVGLYVLMMGVVIVLLYKARRVGIGTIVVGAVWFLFTTRVVIPAFSPSGAVYDSLFGVLGPTATDVVVNSIKHPTLFGRTLAQHKAEDGFVRMVRPLGYVPLGAPVVMLMGLPQHIINFLSVQSFTWDPTAHYFMFPFISVMAAAVRTVISRARVWMAWALMGVMVIGVVATQDQGVGPWTNNAAIGFWPTVSTPRDHKIANLMAKVPGGVAVSANSDLVPHLAHRPEIYTFPNPWRSSNFGPGSKPAHRSPHRVQWMLIEQGQLTGEDATLFTTILRSDQFSVVAMSNLADPGTPADNLYLMRRI